MKYGKLFVAVALVLISACGSSGPIRPPDPIEPPPEPARAVLHISVTDQVTGAPIVDARVDLSAIDGEDDGRTSDTGYWGVQLPILQPGEAYRVEVHAEGYPVDGRDVSFSHTDLRCTTFAIHPSPPPTCERDATFTLQKPAPPIVAPWVGRLRIAQNQRGFIDEDGRWQLPLIAHFGEGFSAFVHGKSVRHPRTGALVSVEDQLRAIKAAGYDGVRSWIHLGYYQGAWNGKEVSPFTFEGDDGTVVRPTPRYYERFIEWLQLLDRLGLRYHLTQGDLNSVSPSDVRRHYQEIAGLVDAHGLQHVIAIAEAINEDHMNGGFGPEALLEWVTPFKNRGYITASSCPVGCTEEDADVIAYSRGFSVRYYHGFRVGEATDRLRHIFTTSYEAPDGTPRLAWEGEPIGPNNFRGLGVSIHHTEDVEELGLLAVERFVARGAWTYMSQYGVFWEGAIDVHSGFAVVPKMRAALQAFAPDVMTWPTLVHGGRSEAVLVSPIGYHYEGGPPEGPARIDQAVSPDGRKAVAIVHGGRGRKPISNRMGCRATVTVVAPRADETVQTDTFTLAPGESRDLSYRVGRMVLAECQP